MSWFGLLYPIVFCSDIFISFVFTQLPNTIVSRYLCSFSIKIPEILLLSQVPPALITLLNAQFV